MEYDVHSPLVERDDGSRIQVVVTVLLVQHGEAKPPHYHFRAGVHLLACRRSPALQLGPRS
ncbi:hypothetical protein GGF31_004359 [Allomyces arbusculus]|nr:hypothetical protein GGF31_004359 [Allomyces arbusculus]